MDVFSNWKDSKRRAKARETNTPLRPSKSPHGNSPSPSKRDAAMGEKVGAGQARAQAIENLPPGMKAADLDAMADKLVKQDFLTPVAAFTMLSGLLSARGNAPIKAVADAADIAAQISSTALFV